jgi:hypothetical protein
MRMASPPDGAAPPLGPVFHVGLPKTGTSFLQERFFPGLGIPFHTTHGRALPRSMDWVYRINGRWIDERLPRDRRRSMLEKIAEREIKAVPELASAGTAGGCTLVSAEGLCGVSHDPLLNSGAIARRLAALHPGARAVICVRDHADWCESIYRQLVMREDRFGRFIPFDRFFSTDPDVEAVVQVGDLQWSELARAWGDALGPDRVLVLRYEQLRDEPHAFLDVLARFIVGRSVSSTDAGMRVNDSSGTDRHRATPLVRKFARMARAIAAANGPRVVWEARTIPHAIRDGLHGRHTFAGCDAAARKRITECARPDRERLEAMIGTRTATTGWAEPR